MLVLERVPELGLATAPVLAPAVHAHGLGLALVRVLVPSLARLSRALVVRAPALSLVRPVPAL